MPNYVYLVRHGETEFNNKGITHGQYDVPLNELGKKQAKLLGVELKNVHFDVCFCSPLTRAKQTSKEILKYHPDVPVIYDDRLKEIFKGDLENTTEYPPDYLHNEKLDVLMRHNVESHAHFYSRVASVLNEVTSQFHDKDILIVCHCGTVKMSMIYFNPPDVCIEESYYKLEVKNCSVKRFENKKSDKNPILVTYPVDKEQWPLIAI